MENTPDIKFNIYSGILVYAPGSEPETEQSANGRMPPDTGDRLIATPIFYHQGPEISGTFYNRLRK